jgi:hypothetical protein
MIVLSLFSAALAAWVAAFLSRPRLPVPGNEAAEIVYSRLMGNKDGIQLFAVLLSYAAIFAAVITLTRL